MRRKRKLKPGECDECNATGKQCDFELSSCDDCNGTAVYQEKGPCRHCHEIIVVDGKQRGSGKHRTKRTKKLIVCDAAFGGCGGTGLLPRGKGKPCKCIDAPGPPGARWSRKNFRTCCKCGGSGAYQEGSMTLDRVLPDDALKALDSLK